MDLTTNYYFIHFHNLSYVKLELITWFLSWHVFGRVQYYHGVYVRRLRGKHNKDKFIMSVPLLKILLFLIKNHLPYKGDMKSSQMKHWSLVKCPMKNHHWSLNTLMFCSMQNLIDWKKELD